MNRELIKITNEYLDFKTARLEWFAAGLFRKLPAPFILLSSQRCGNNMLRSALNQHLQLHFDSEVFRFALKPDCYGLIREKYIKLVEKEPCRAFVTILKDGIGKRAAGFTLFYSHALQKPQDQLWRFMRNFPKLRVVELRRKNLFMQWLSLTEALTHDHWVVYPGMQHRKTPPVTLEPQTFVDWLEEQDVHRAFAIDHVGHHRQLEIFYEDMLEDFPGTCRRVVEFLGADYQDVETMTEKTGTRKLKERIANFDDFAERMEGLSGESYFTEAVEAEL